MDVYLLNPKATLDHIGLIPSFLSELDPRPAAQQFNERYCSGWRPQEKFQLRDDESLKYPGDPPMHPFAVMRFRDETIYIYEHGYVAIVQPDRSFEACRMD
jgi:hypothetical protein